MLKCLLVSTALVAGVSVSAQAGTMQAGRSSSVHAHRVHHNHRVSYGVGGGDHRTTATGGNAGGYTSRN